MNSKNQVQRKMVQLNDENYVIRSCVTYGLWSKFNPLSIKAQVGQYGIFDSQCFHLHNAMDFELKNLNIVYFDCINKESRKIIKTIKFINQKNQQFKFDIVIDEFDYEDIWFFFQIMIWPQQNKLKLLILKKQEILFQTTEQMKNLLKDLTLILTFGGNLQVQNNENQIFSYFPGSLWLQEVSTEKLSLDFNFMDLIISIYESNFESCICLQNDIHQIGDKDFSNQQQNQFVSKNKSCDSFILSGWIKIKDIINLSEKLIYQFLKISANLENPKLQNQNLSPFQLFYHVSSEINEIVITTYNYTFPDVTTDFTNNPFLLQKTFQIQNNIKLWHSLKVELSKTLFKVEIKFYEENKINIYNVEFNVHQFQQCQYKIYYGNVLKISPNYLNLQIRNLDFLNCYQKQDNLSCHSDCLECDGPTNNDCLSCSVESKRIYIPEHKVCICPFGTIDNQNECQNFKESNIQLIKDENLNIIKNCQYGYFELDGDCYLCPSILNDKIITCNECLSNLKNWFNKPNCFNIFIIEPNIITEYYYQQTSQDWFYFDGIDFNTIRITHSYDLNLTNINGIFREFQSVQTYFQRFCQQIHLNYIDQVEIDSQTCYRCLIENCQICQISLVTIQCLKCVEDYLLIDGNCMPKQEIISSQDLICLLPYYYSFENSCKLCEIKNCIHCFEYSKKDINQCSFLNFFNIDLPKQSNIEIGCALCEQDYIFDFTLGLCINQKPQIQNCKRSFINLKSKEICIQSFNSDFSIAPEISNCNDQIQNCQYCTISQKIEIICVTCQINYIIKNNNCLPDDEFDIDELIIQNQINQIQSFALQFVPYLNVKVYKYFLNPEESYINFCSSECLLCIDSPFTYCKECPLNYYKKPTFTEESSDCQFCPPLCQVCSDRLNSEIQENFPNFIITDESKIYSKKCFRSYNDPQIMLNPYSNFVKYCYNRYNNSCQDKFLFESTITTCDFARFDRTYETLINIQYCNHVGMESLTFSFIIKILTQHCQMLIPIDFQTQLKQKIFTLQNVNFNLSGYKFVELSIPSTLMFNNFDQVQINNLAIIISENQYLHFDNNNNKINFILNNFSILNSSFNNINSFFQTSVFGNIIIKNFTIINSNFINSVIFNLQNSLLLGQIEIIQLFIHNCTFIQSEFFKFQKIEYPISISQFVLNQSILNQSSIFSFLNNYPQQGFLTGQNIQILNCSFIYSCFINSTNQIKVNLNNFDFYFNKLEISKIITVSFEITINSTKIQENLFFFSQFLTITQIHFQNQIFNEINYMNIEYNYFKTSNIILSYSTFQTNNLKIYLKNFVIQQNNLYSNYDENIELFYMNSQEIQIQNFVIIENTNLIIFYISENNQILISNLIFKSSKQYDRIPLSQNCLKFRQKTKLLQIYGFTKIEITNVKISDIFNIDGSIIQITTSQKVQSISNSQIQIQNLSFIRNKIIQTTLTEQISCLQIESESRINVMLNNISYIENFLHSYESGAVGATTSLLNVISSSSLIEIKNILYQNNALTNSSNSLTILRSHILNIINIKIDNINILSQELWTNHYDIQFKEQFNQDTLNEIIIQILQIKTIGGVGQISASNFSCLNCTFSNILAMDSMIFHITTIADGIINFINLTVNLIENNLKSIEKNTGCFHIQSQDSKLNLSIKNSQFTNIFNRLAPSILSINPSKQSNSIFLKEINVFNCISLIDSILNVQFSSSIMDKNQVIIQNIRIVQTYVAWIYYFTRIRDLIIQEVTDIINNKNSLIFIQSSNVSINGFIMEGILINSIFQFDNIPKLQISNVQFQNIEVFFSFNLLQITQFLQIKYLIYFQNFSIRNISLYQNNMNQIQTNFITSNYLKECTSYVEYFGSLQQDYLYISINLFQQINNQQKSVIKINSLSTKNVILFKNLQLDNNICSQCDYGMVFFEIQEFKQIKIQNLNCNYNTIKKFGCLYFYQQNEIQSKIVIENSNFLFNNGSQGTGIFSEKAKVKLKQCYVIKNYAKDFGGGLYFKENCFDFLISQSYIIDNRARIGGGIHLDNKCNLNNKNFLQSILLFNQAQEYGDNIIEIPTHLAVFINSIENPSQLQFINNKQINILNIKTYRMVEQGSQILTNDLYIPSNQMIKNFKIFDIHNSNYKSFIKDIRFFYKNSRNEILFNLFNSSCKIKNKIITKNFQEFNQDRDVQTLYFENQMNSFDFGSLSFSLDPYEQNYKYLQIEINCQLNESNNNLLYIINAKSLKCQLGEFYINNGCQICQSDQGYYSVTYNTTKCSIFDKSKYSEITQNMINLLPGFWRPNNLSDQAEYCFKNPKFCNGGWQVGDYSCNQGHLGGLCEECDVYNIRGFGNYFKNQWDSQCLECQIEWNSFFTFFIVGIWSFLSIFMSLNSIHSSNLLYIAQRFNKILFKLNQDLESIQIKLLINYLWIFSVIFTFNIDFSFSFIVIEQTSDSSYFMAKDLDCYLSYIEQIPIIYLKILTMLIIVMIQFNITFAVSYLYAYIKKHKYDQSILSNTALYLYVFNFAGLIKMFSSVVSKRQISHLDYIQGDLSIRYGTQNHYIWMFYFILPGLIIVGIFIPIFISILMMINKNRLDQIKLRKHISYLLNEYKEQKYYWEQIKLFKKGILIFILTNFETDIVLKASLLGLCLLIYQILTTFHQPFINLKFNQQDLQSCQICSISIFLAIVKYICEQNNYLGPSITIQIILIGCLIKLCFIFTLGIATAYLQKYKPVFLNKLYLFLNSKIPNFNFTKLLRNILKKENKRKKRIKYLFKTLRNHLIKCSQIQLRSQKLFLSSSNSKFISIRNHQFISHIMEIHESNKR
ncbi:unnamed protein product [Paramecium sonneborni]|uniref:Transmembrane protein n=1 Tax=Paramecium sonneborni TaxID=65129 RepID=A0A8S1PP99_9CILI|nr:unnamed protein product [Paramecium sonneborni]